MTSLIGTWSVQGFARRGLLRGAASALDLRGDTRRQYFMFRDAESADAAAVRNDWRVVGDDLARAMATSGLAKSA